MDYSISDYERPSVAVDAVVFGVDSVKTETTEEKILKILLVRRGEEPFKDMFSLAGGFLRPGETVEEAVKRELLEEAGVEDVKIIPLKVYSEADRDPRGWIISDAFISLTNTVRLSTDENSDACEALWFDFAFRTDGRTEKIILSDGLTEIEITVTDGVISENQPLAFDHARIIYDAFKKLQDEVQYHDIIFDLMPEMFTISDVYNPYRTILNRNETIQAFRKRIMPKITPTDFFENTSSAHRKSRLYKKL